MNSSDFSINPVSKSATVSGLRLAKFITGIVISIPLLVTAAQIGSTAGLTVSLGAFVAGGAILAVIGSCAAIVGSKTKLTTYLIMQFPFGVQGAKLVNAVIGVTIFGWYSVTAGVFGRATHAAVVQVFGSAGGLDETAFVLLGSALMISVTVFGFRALDRVATVAVPALVLFLAYLVFASVGEADVVSVLANPEGSMSFGMATSAVVASFIVGVVVFPDFLRFAHDARHSIAAAVLSMGVALPLIYLAAAVPSVATGQRDVVVLLMQMGLGLPALLLLIFATITTNTVNLYSASLVLASIVRRAPLWILTLVCGLAATLVAVSGGTDTLESFLLLLSVLVPPIAGIYLADFFVIEKQRFDVGSLALRPKVNYAAFVAWIAGTAVGYVGTTDALLLSRIPAVDSLLVSSAVHTALQLGSRTWLARSNGGTEAPVDSED